MTNPAPRTTQQREERDLALFRAELDARIDLGARTRRHHAAIARIAPKGNNWKLWALGPRFVLKVRQVGFRSAMEAAGARLRASVRGGGR